jgi:hypothetical protein
MVGVYEIIEAAKSVESFMKFTALLAAHRRKSYICGDFMFHEYFFI